MQVFWTIFLFVTLSAFIQAAKRQTNRQTCKCWEGYRVDFSSTGPQCVAINLFHIMPCNMIKSPKCKCTGRVSNILKDRTGTWCTRYRKGQEYMRWPCENVQEWDDFFKKHPDFI